MAAKKKAQAKAKAKAKKKSASVKKSRLTRARHRMPGWVREAIERRKLGAKYDARPAYQKNDYLGWIASAKTEATKQKRLAQMLDELGKGDVYMKMRWSPERVRAAR